MPAYPSPDDLSADARATSQAALGQADGEPDELPCRALDEFAGDEQLVSQLADGCRAALAPLHRRYVGLVFSIAARRLGSAAAEEVVQDIFVDVWRRAATFDGRRGDFRPWLLRLAHWRILNELRRRYHRPGPSADADADLDALVDDEPEPFELVAGAERRATMQTALLVLPQSQREAVALAFLEERTHEEVSLALDLPLGTTKTRIRAGLRRLRVQLAPIAATL
jgi:RNA polymerase sigma-70 factor (ECF subfamily)